MTPSRYNSNFVDITDLEGHTVKGVSGLHKDSERIVFSMEDGSEYTMLHFQDCCERVAVEDVYGDASMLEGCEVLDAHESTNRDDPPHDHSYGTFTWTFYEIRTRGGTVTIRWLGESNGYYSEDVDIIKD